MEILDKGRVLPAVQHSLNGIYRENGKMEESFCYVNLGMVDFTQLRRSSETKLMSGTWSLCAAIRFAFEIGQSMKTAWHWKPGCSNVSFIWSKISVIAAHPFFTIQNPFS